MVDLPASQVGRLGSHEPVGRGSSPYVLGSAMI